METISVDLRAGRFGLILGGSLKLYYILTHVPFDFVLPACALIFGGSRLAFHFVCVARWASCGVLATCHMPMSCWHVGSARGTKKRRVGSLLSFFPLGSSFSFSFRFRFVFVSFRVRFCFRSRFVFRFVFVSFSFSF